MSDSFDPRRWERRDESPDPVGPGAEPGWKRIVAEQGILPIEDVGELYGDFWPEEETIEMFLAALRSWRREGRQ